MTTQTIEQIFDKFSDIVRDSDYGNDNFNKAKKIFEEYKNNNEFMTKFDEEFDEEFYNICVSGYLELAQWFYELKLKPTENIELLFCDVCSEGHFEIAKWLLEIKPTIVEDEYIMKMNIL